jgi:DNA-binding transcriptional MerR regulator
MIAPTPQPDTSERPVGDDTPPTELTTPEPREFSIDELAAATGVPSRTIRFYQSKGALQKPEIRGRKAYYNDAHVQRLQLVGQLQDRGLRIKAIRDLVGRVDRGELVVSEWLGLQDALVAPWADEAPRLFTEDELTALVGELAPGRFAALVRAGLLERQRGRVLCPSVQRLQTVLQLEGRGVSIEVSAAALEQVARHTAKLARELAALFESRAGDGFGGTDPKELGDALEGWRAHGPGLVTGVFAEQMQRVLVELVATGRGGKLQG